MDSLATQILDIFYRKSYLHIFEHKFIFDGKKLIDNSCFYDFIRLNYTNKIQSYVKRRIDSYQSSLSPSVKIDLLINYLKNGLNNKTLSVLDYGCGCGFVLRYFLKHADYIKNAWGIDADISVLPQNKSFKNKKGLSTYWCSNLIDCKINPSSLDLIIITFTLHHLSISEQSNIVKQLSLLLKPGGILYLLEDSWPTNNEFNTSDNPELDSMFNKLSLDEKHLIFSRNEFVANSWFYNRSFNYKNCTHKKSSYWLELLNSNGLEIELYGTVGFNANRLHGVPSLWVISKKLI